MTPASIGISAVKCSPPHGFLRLPVTFSAVEIVFAALSALIYGTADFFGGLASQRVPALVVTVISQMVGLGLLVVVAPLWPHPDLTGIDWAWGAAGGLMGAFGLALFYAALARGPMAVVALVTALVSAILPVIVGVVEGDRPHPLAWVGVVVALGAIGLVAGTHRGSVHVDRRTLSSSVAAGVGFGSFFVLLAQTHSGAGLIPLLAARTASVSIVMVAVVVSRRRLRLGSGNRLLVVSTGVFDVFANSLYLMAVSTGLLSTVAVVSAMYPASTVVLARVVLGERLSFGQRLGLIAAAIAVVLVALGGG